MRALVAVVLLLVSAVVPVISFPTGAPLEACSTVTPNHPPASEQTSTNPYSIDLSVFDDGSGGFRYLPGRTYQLTLSAAGNSPTFRGFFIQGRLAADDSPGVGTFVTPAPGSVARLSSCSTPSSAITHNSRSDKDSVTVSWTAPRSAGTGAVTFAYAVVQTMNTFWANERTFTIHENNCTSPPFYESSGLCVETCPTNEFGNHTSGHCEQYPADYQISLNATAYAAEITADTPFGTPVIYFSFVIDGSALPSPSVFLSVVENNLVERTFTFPNGQNDEEYFFTPDPGTNTRTIVNQIVYSDDPRIPPPGQPPPNLVLPAMLGMNINLVAVDTTVSPPVVVERSNSIRAVVTVNPPPDPCQPDPCMNGATCNAQNTTSYTCTCPPDFTGNNCQMQINDCGGVNCGNGTCVDGVESFQCVCSPGFTDMFCGTNINECETIGCVNGVCTDLINGIECACYPGWTGANCSLDINHCEPQPFGPCDTTGSVGCNDGNTTYTCNCVIGFTGNTCSQDIDECQSIPASTSEPACYNGGTCTNLLFGRFECNCPSDYSGDRCETDITPCDPDPCENGGTCIQNGISDFTCNCPPGYTGLNCSTEINECMSDPCDNGGTCTDIVNGFICQCPEGYSGATCDVDEDFCTSETCQNNGTCVEGNGTETTCVCAEGFSGSNCTTDLSFCTPTTCMNGGTCIEGTGAMITCDCPTGFTGMMCETDPPDCEPTTCDNGGTCMEEYGPATSCNCADGFNGTTCQIDLPFCEVDTCLNGGTCNEGLGTITTCDCAAGFTGANCSVDLDFCDESTCLNGGTCNEEFGTMTTCDCAAGFTGTNCSVDLDFCIEDTCLNGGTCNEEFGTMTTCSCAAGFTGANCSVDLDFCTENTCLNGGTCNEGFGTMTTCDCAAGFTTANCSVDLDFCTEDSCFNGGTCNEDFGTMTICDCAAGFTGANCSVDLDFCTEDTCLNGGTCNEDFGTMTTCDCAPGFTGTNCSVDLDFCTENTCLNGGTCNEELGTMTTCDCAPGFTGANCSVDLDFCTEDTCLNGGTCNEEFGTMTTCDCAAGFTGANCSVDLDFCTEDTCLNGGTCNEGFGTVTTCDCAAGFTGANCSVDLAFCTPTTCSFGGTCFEESGEQIRCECVAGYTGMLCDEDDTNTTFCTPTTCMNGGTCVEEFGPDTSCSCPEGYTSANCSTDIDFCTVDTCLNGGTCNEGSGTVTTCDCAAGFTGVNCSIDVDFCTLGTCLNGGTCNEGLGTVTTCDCAAGFTGANCSVDIDFCTVDTCLNGGTCFEGLGIETSCSCLNGFMGDRCGVVDICAPNPCQNGGTCTPSGLSYVCSCEPSFTGPNCTIEVIGGCRNDNECSAADFCEITCASDSYSSHTALLTQRVNLTGTSFVRVDQSRYPDLSGDVSIFAIFNQEPGNDGYLVFYGTSEDKRNLAVFLDGGHDPRIWLYYTNTMNETKEVFVSANFSDGQTHYLAVTIDISPGVARFYLDGEVLPDGRRMLQNPNLTAEVSASNPASLFVGARLMRHYRFIGEIWNVIFFSEVITPEFVSQLQMDYPMLLAPVGSCVPYLTSGAVCPTPSTEPSLLCSSTSQTCHPSLRCLPRVNDVYTCQPAPVECTSDSDCATGYFCGSKLPPYGSNFYDNPGAVLPGQTMFLQQTMMGFDGSSVVSLPANSHPALVTDLTIFATVCQDVGNDGYVVGKGVNDRMRDFGLYLRSSKRTIWLAYGAEGNTPGFREILFFYDVSVADGSCHSVTAVVDSASNRAVLYIDGKAVGLRFPLPSFPEFRPGFNMLYVGGRPSTRLFRFSGSISNLFVSTAALSLDNVITLHNQALEGGTINIINVTSDSSVRYCYQYETEFEECYVNSFEGNDFRCQAPAECVPSFSNSDVVSLPTSGSTAPLRVLGRCTNPCPQECGFSPQDLKCGTDGRTYFNTCYMNCVNVPLLHDGQCQDYVSIYP